MSCNLPKSDFETMKQQACVYRSNGELSCGDFVDSVQEILRDTKTLFGPQMANKPKDTGSCKKEELGLMMCGKK
jgi:hypothetical protein